jgi:hypothetical protein
MICVCRSGGGTGGQRRRRRRANKGFAYFDANARIQATGRDARGRKQERRRAVYREAREAAKLQHTLRLTAALPGVRAAVAQHAALHGLPRKRVPATVVHLLETTMICSPSPSPRRLATPLRRPENHISALP